MDAVGTHSIPEPYRLPILRRLARDGDAYAMYALSCVLRGREIWRADPESMRWLRRAARTLPPAQVGLALRLSPDWRRWSWSRRAEPWWKKAASAGHPAALPYLALRWLPHRGDPRRRRKAKALLVRAARAGSAEAAFDLATRVETLAGNLVEVERWLRVAAIRGLHEPKYDFALELVRRARPFLYRFEARPVRTWRAEARTGDLDAAVHLAYAQRFGRGVPYAPRVAVLTFERASRLGSFEAPVALALHGFDVETFACRLEMDEGAAAVRAAVTGDPTALWLAGVLEAGYGARERRRAAGRLERAARRGHASAACALASRYGKGFGVPKSPARALRFARIAAEAGHDGGMMKLADLLGGGQGVRPNPREAVRWLRRAAALDAPDAATDLGVRLHEGRGVRRDDREAVFWYRRAAAQGCSSGAANLGRCYRYGDGVREDSRVAARWLRRAADVLESASAAGVLGSMYARGELGRESAGRAATWFRRSAAMGDAEALGNLGAAYHSGRGVPEDFEFSVLLYRAGAAKGDGWSAYCLGLCYRDGEGVRRNRRHARRWFGVAIERGVVDARSALAALGKRRVATARGSAARTTTGLRTARCASPSRGRGP